MDRMKVQLETEIVNELIKLKEVGDTYSDVIRRLLKYKHKYIEEQRGCNAKDL